MMTTGYSLPICDEERGDPRQRKKKTAAADETATLGKRRISSISLCLGHLVSWQFIPEATCKLARCRRRCFVNIFRPTILQVYLR